MVFSHNRKRKRKRKRKKKVIQNLGATDTTTGRVIEIAYVNGILWQEVFNLAFCILKFLFILFYS
jgi:hypothetical protein